MASPIALVVLVSLCGGVESAWAAPRIASLSVGVAGVYRTDRWCPVDVRFADVDAGGEFALEIVAADPGGRRIAYISTVRLSPRAENRAAQLVRLGPTAAPIVVTLRDGDGAVIDERRSSPSDLARPLAAEESLVLVVGRLSGLDAVEYVPQGEGRRAVHRQSASILQLPALDWRSTGDRTLALDAVDTVVWLAGQSSEELRSESSGRLLDDWVRGGGRLILSLGPHASAPLADAAWLRQASTRPAGEPAELRQIGPLEAIIGEEATSRTARAAAAADTPAFRLPIVRITADDGRVVAATGQTADAAPLVIRVPHGFGEIVVVAFDLADDALATWPGRGRLLATIFALGEESAATSPADRANQSAGTGSWAGKAYTSLDEQLADALDQFPGASPARFWYLAAAAIAYALVIGPIDWYVVRRRPEWTWATFLASVAVAATAGYAVVHATKPDEVLVNQLSFVDVDMTTVESPAGDAPANGASSSQRERSVRVRGVAWTCFYQPTAARLDVGVAPPSFHFPSSASEDAAASCRARLSLWDRTSAAGAEQLLSIGEPDAAEVVRYDAAGVISDVKRPAWSTQHLVGQWSFDAALPLAASLEADAFGRVVGEVRNPLDEPLEQAVLFYGTLAHALGTLAPGQTVAVDGRSDWRSAEAFLTRRRFSVDRETAERYDATNFDLDRIGEVIGFYNAAGGKPYVGLDRRGFERLDLSGQLRLGRAILVGRTSVGTRVAVSSSGQRDANDRADDAASAHRESTRWRFLFRVAAADSPAG